MLRALVTGSPDRLGAAAATLGRAGFEVVVSPTASGPFDCYVQLPCGPTEPVGRIPAPDLVCRIDALAAVAGRLQPNASIILGVDDGEASGPSEPVRAGGDLLAAVALALLEDVGRPAARIAVLPVSDLCRPAEEGGAAVIRLAQWEIPTPPLVSAP
jgi:hypothetical protein